MVRDATSGADQFPHCNLPEGALVLARLPHKTKQNCAFALFGLVACVRHSAIRILKTYHAFLWTWWGVGASGHLEQDVAESDIYFRVSLSEPRQPRQASRAGHTLRGPWSIGCHPALSFTGFRLFHHSLVQCCFRRCFVVSTVLLPGRHC